MRTYLPESPGTTETRMIATELRERGLMAPGADVVVVGASRADGGRRTNLIRLVHIRGG